MQKFLFEMQTQMANNVVVFQILFWKIIKSNDIVHHFNMRLETCNFCLLSQVLNLLKNLLTLEPLFKFSDQMSLFKKCQISPSNL